MGNELKLDGNAVALLGLAKEYCVALENAQEAEREEFVDSMLRFLPRLYIMVSDLKPGGGDGMFEDAFSGGYLENRLEEDYYDAVRRNVETLMGEDDVYLEVFEQEMKYSDTPVSASISEGLADIFQPLYNLLATVQYDSTDETVQEALAAVKEEFQNYWSATLCNVMRALNRIKMGES